MNRSQETMDARTVCRIWAVSRATLSRWVTMGCPVVMLPGNPRKQGFIPDEVKTWLGQKELPTTSRGFPSRRFIKQYWIFDWDGMYVETAWGSRKACQALMKIGRDPDTPFRPCAIDNQKNQYIAYGGKLRRYNPRRHHYIDWNQSEFEDLLMENSKENHGEV